MFFLGRRKLHLSDGRLPLFSIADAPAKTEYQGVIMLLSSCFMATWGGDFALADVRKVSLFKTSPDHGCCWRTRLTPPRSSVVTSRKRA